MGEKKKYRFLLYAGLYRKYVYDEYKDPLNWDSSKENKFVCVCLNCTLCFVLFVVGMWCM